MRKEVKRGRGEEGCLCGVILFVFTCVSTRVFPSFLLVCFLLLIFPLLLPPPPPSLCVRLCLYVCYVCVCVYVYVCVCVCVCTCVYVCV